jgi:hypothetical protein
MRLDPHYEWVKWDLAWALWTNGDCDQALSALLSMAKLPNMARRSLAVIYVCLGRQEEAEATIAKFLEIKPEYTVSSYRDSYQHRYKDPTGVEPFLDGLRKAGLPE